MKIYILTDLEGPAMVSRFNQTREEGPQKQTAMKLLTWEVNAAITGILDVDSQAEIVVWDGHGNGGIDVLEFHPEAKLITRGPITPPYYYNLSRLLYPATIPPPDPIRCQPLISSYTPSQSCICAHYRANTAYLA